MLDILPWQAVANRLREGQVAAQRPGRHPLEPYRATTFWVLDRLLGVLDRQPGVLERLLGVLERRPGALGFSPWCTDSCSPIRAHPPVAEVPEPRRDARPGPITTTTSAPVALDTGGGPSTAVRTADEVSPKAPKSCGSASEPAVSSGYTKVEGTVVSAVTAASVPYPLACSWVLSTAAMPFTLVPFATKICTDPAVGAVDVDAGGLVDGAVDPGVVEPEEAP